MSDHGDGFTHPRMPVYDVDLGVGFEVLGTDLCFFPFLAERSLFANLRNDTP